MSSGPPSYQVVPPGHGQGPIRDLGRRISVPVIGVGLVALLIGLAADAGLLTLLGSFILVVGIVWKASRW